MTATAWPFIQIADDGVPFLQDGRVKALDLVLDHLAYGWDASEIHRQHPHLSLAEIYAALGYYHENKSHCDRLIDEQLSRLDREVDALKNPSLQDRLHARKRAE